MKQVGSMKMVLTLFLIMTLIFTGCSQANEGTNSPSNTEKEQPEEPKVNYPEDAITLIVPFAVGGGTDTVARGIAEEASKILGKKILVENIVGAAGAIGTTEAAIAEPDGYTLVIGTTGLFTTIPLLNETKYSIDDFVGIEGLTQNPSYLIVNADSPYQTIDDLMKEQSTDKVISFGNNGIGSIPHLTQAYFFNKSDIKSKSVTYKGTAPTIVALLGGHIDTVSANTAGFSANEEAGKIRVLANFSSERSAAFPDVPTIKEKGIDMNMGVTNFILAPKDTPDEVVKILRDAFAQAKESERFRSLLEKIQSEQTPLKGEDIVETMKQEAEAYKDVIETLGISK